MAGVASGCNTLARQNLNRFLLEKHSEAYKEAKEDSSANYKAAVHLYLSSHILPSESQLHTR